MRIPALHVPGGWPCARIVTLLGLTVPTQVTASPCCWTHNGSRVTSPSGTASSPSYWQTHWGGTGLPSWYPRGLKGGLGPEGGSPREEHSGTVLPRWPACPPLPSAFLKLSAPCDMQAELSGSPLGHRPPRCMEGDTSRSTGRGDGGGSGNGWSLSWQQG